MKPEGLLKLWAIAQKHQAKSFVAIIAFIILFIAWHHYENSIDIYELSWAVETHADVKVVSDRLASRGDSAIQAILQQISERSPYSKTTVALMGVLAQMGQPAQIQLIHAINNETDYHIRSYYIYTLQTAFADFSHIGVWLNEAKQYPLDYKLIRYSLARKFGQTTPAILSDSGNYNSEFLSWYKQHSRPKGFLPAWKP